MQFFEGSIFLVTVIVICALLLRYAQVVPIFYLLDQQFRSTSHQLTKPKLLGWHFAKKRKGRKVNAYVCVYLLKQPSTHLHISFIWKKEEGLVLSLSSTGSQIRNCNLNIFCPHSTRFSPFFFCQLSFDLLLLYAQNQWMNCHNTTVAVFCRRKRHHHHMVVKLCVQEKMWMYAQNDIHTLPLHTHTVPVFGKEQDGTELGWKVHSMSFALSPTLPNVIQCS